MRLDITHVLQRVAERTTCDDSGKLVEAFVRGLGGDPFGVALEEAAEDREIGDELKALPEKVRRVRSHLTDR